MFGLNNSTAYAILAMFHAMTCFGLDKVVAYMAMAAIYGWLSRSH